LLDLDTVNRHPTRRHIMLSTVDPTAYFTTSPFLAISLSAVWAIAALVAFIVIAGEVVKERWLFLILPVLAAGVITIGIAWPQTPDYTALLESDFQVEVLSDVESGDSAYSDLPGGTFAFAARVNGEPKNCTLVVNEERLSVEAFCADGTVLEQR
jgi:hypothetical protein